MNFANPLSLSLSSTFFDSRLTEIQQEFVKMDSHDTISINSPPSIQCSFAFDEFDLAGLGDSLGNFHHINTNTSAPKIGNAPELERFTSNDAVASLHGGRPATLLEPIDTSESTLSTSFHGDNLMAMSLNEYPSIPRRRRRYISVIPNPPNDKNKPFSNGEPENEERDDNHEEEEEHSQLPTYVQCSALGVDNLSGGIPEVIYVIRPQWHWRQKLAKSWKGLVIKSKFHRNRLGEF